MLDPLKPLLRGYGSRSIRCNECRKSFLPHPRLKSRQKTCTQKEYQLAYRARYRKKYRRTNLQAEEDYREKTKSNRRSDFWKTYREKHRG